MNFLVPHWIVKVLCVLFFILNLISICLCLSALFLLLLASLNLGHLFGQPPPPPPTWTLSPPLIDPNGTVANSTIRPDSFDSLPSPHSPSIPYNLIVYLLFYLTVAILGVLGATTRFRRKKTYFLIAHILLLLGVICFNLLAWFHFRAYSPLDSSPYDELHLFLASIFDFVDFFLGLSLLIVLFINRMYAGHKQRNSIEPMAVCEDVATCCGNMLKSTIRPNNKTWINQKTMTRLSQHNHNYRNSIVKVNLFS